MQGGGAAGNQGHGAAGVPGCGTASYGVHGAAGMQGHGDAGKKSPFDAHQSTGAASSSAEPKQVDVPDLVPAQKKNRKADVPAVVPAQEKERRRSLAREQRDPKRHKSSTSRSEIGSRPKQLSETKAKKVEWLKVSQKDIEEMADCVLVVRPEGQGERRRKHVHLILF